MTISSLPCAPGHTNKQQIASLKHLWAHVRPGGVYVIEDLETQYYGEKIPTFGCYGIVRTRPARLLTFT